MIGRNPDRDHVLLDVLANVNTGVKTVRHDISATVFRRHIEHDFGILLVQSAELWSKNRRDCKTRQQKPDSSHGSLGLPRNLIQSLSYFGKGGLQPEKEPLSCFG